MQSKFKDVVRVVEGSNARLVVAAALITFALVGSAQAQESTSTTQPELRAEAITKAAEAKAAAEVAAEAAASYAKAMDAYSKTVPTDKDAASSAKRAAATANTIKAAVTGDYEVHCSGCTHP